MINFRSLLSDKKDMVAVSKIFFTIICIFFLIFYFFILPLPKLISKYEIFMQKQITINILKEENQSIKTVLAQLDEENIESLKYIIYEKAENEIYVKFPEDKINIPTYSFPYKNIINLLYYLFGVAIFSIIFINLILSEEESYIISKSKRKTKFYCSDN